MNYLCCTLSCCDNKIISTRRPILLSQQDNFPLGQPILLSQQDSLPGWTLSCCDNKIGRRVGIILLSQQDSVPKPPPPLPFAQANSSASASSTPPPRLPQATMDDHDYEPPWRSVHIEESSVAVKGGRLPKEDCVLAPKRYVGEDECTDFTLHGIYLKIDKGQAWLYKTVFGKTAQRGNFFKYQGFEELERKMWQKRDDCSDPSDDSPGSNTSSDIMSALRPVEGDFPAAKRRKTTVAKRKTQVFEVDMPCAFEGDPDVTRGVRVMRVGKGFWIHADDAAWFIEYLHGESLHKTRCTSEPSGVRIDFCFKRHAWIAVIEDGNHKFAGGEPFKQAPHSLTADQWTEAAYLHKIESGFANATSEQKREAARCWLMHYMQTHV